jgi:hypothetical protein
MITDEIEAMNTTITVSAGISPETGLIADIFFAGTKNGSMINLLLNDLGVLISLALQNGIEAEAMLSSMGTVPIGDITEDGNSAGTMPASVLGAALTWIVEMNNLLSPIKE